ncbi:MAG TPA: hypothetical protein PLZ08_02660 [Bacillota bacterium]|nr:hypothetical protein [Bacillota bacterium]HOL09165.1 hypothetical protein [Bacillota bacterium]HPO96840.1 hypothetical protein [Bacillota bacterium]
MKKITLLLLGLILVVSLTVTGCGSGSKKKPATNPTSNPVSDPTTDPTVDPQDEIGASMDQETIRNKFKEINGITLNLQTIVNKCYPKLNLTNISNNQIKASKSTFELEWAGPDNQGWYIQQTEYYTFKIRYLKSSNTVEIVESLLGSTENIKVFQQNS